MLKENSILVLLYDMTGNIKVQPPKENLTKFCIKKKNTY